MDPIDRYRDVILVDAVETLVVKQVKYAVRKCRKIFEKNSFIGLSFGNVETQIDMFSLCCQWTRSARCSSTFTAGPAVEGWRSHIPSVTTGSRSSQSTSSPTWASYSSWVRDGGWWTNLTCSGVQEWSDSSQGRTASPAGGARRGRPRGRRRPSRSTPSVTISVSVSASLTPVLSWSRGGPQDPGVEDVL